MKKMNKTRTNESNTATTNSEPMNEYEKKNNLNQAIAHSFAKDTEISNLN